MKPKITIQLPEEVLGELKDAVVYFQSHGKDVSLAGMVHLAIVTELARLRGKYTKGKRFPKRDKDLRPGRRVDL